MQNFRRSQRYRFQLDVLFRGAFRPTRTLTEDVSFHGVFIRTDEARAPNQLIKFSVIDPRDDQPIDLLGIVARCVKPEEAAPDRPPGVGVSLFGNDRATEARWVALVRRVRQWVEHGFVRPPAGDLARQPTPPLHRPAPEPLSIRRTDAGAAADGDARTTTPRPARPGAGAYRVGPGAATPSAPAGRRAAAETPRPASPAPAARGDSKQADPASSPTPRPEPAPALAQPPAPPPAPSSGPPPPPREPIDAVRRAHVRRPARFNVTLRPEGVDELTQFALKDISEGGTFVLTPTLVPVGSRVNVRLVHPGTGETFSIPGHVVRTIDSIDPNEKGLGIRFEAEAVDHAAWQAFLDRTAPVPAEEAGQVRVVRTPHPPEPPVLLGPEETPAPGAQAPGDPGGAPILLGEDEEPVPLILGPGVGLADDLAPGGPPSRGGTGSDEGD